MTAKRTFRPAILPLEKAKKAAILAAVKQSGGNVVLAAERLEIGKTTLYRKLKQYGAVSKARRKRVNAQ
jgi:transcriptional regulator of acetoin/glycerol metabolism